MSKKVLIQLLFIMITLVITGNNLIHASIWEDKDTPISFKIEMLPWKEVNKILPNKSKFTILDVETGLQFRVQRRAGKQHADVQPLNTHETLIMKKIYNGKWSWKRRAIIVLMNDQMIAASMHGMPHGAGAIQNSFPGHFCVHFSGSITHRIKKEDPSHKIMILKAAGKIDKYLDTLAPPELINILTIAVNQRDKKLLKLITSNSGCSKCLDKLITGITYMEITKLPDVTNNVRGPVVVEIPAQVTIYSKRKGKEKKKVNFLLRKENLTDHWQIDKGSLIRDLNS